ncbi:hypothetical protein ACOI1C_18740 [Bacillus sp. DJP31]|uniref:hypothetical protein n=1 Tax=Bacillus sp. DJP31 TaxID=3409789 RepID=UPI003BB5EC86
MSKFIGRKLLATYVATVITSIILAILGTTNSQFELDYTFVGLTSLTIFYIGIIILVYGNLSSACIEFFYSKWFKKSTWLYIVLHGLSAVAIVFVFHAWDLWLFTLLGIVVALFYACLDRWIAKHHDKVKYIVILFLAPILLFGLVWGYFKLISPPFTPEHAIEQTLQAFLPNDIGLFPEDSGIWKGKIDGFSVVRETAVEKIEVNTYIVTFTETWADENSSGSRFKSYRASPSGTSSYDDGGFSPVIKEEIQ